MSSSKPFYIVVLSLWLVLGLVDGFTLFRYSNGIRQSVCSNEFSQIGASKAGDATGTSTATELTEEQVGQGVCESNVVTFCLSVFP